MLKPQDIFVLLAISQLAETDWTYDRMGCDLGLSSSQVFKALERAEASHLFIKQSRMVIKRNVVEFLLHGIRYAFAVEPGRLVRGVPASWKAPGLDELMVEDESNTRVWPSASGTARGQAIEPLHAALPQVAQADPALHTLLALVDIMRTGSARERKVAGAEIERRLV